MSLLPVRRANIAPGPGRATGVDPPTMAFWAFRLQGRRRQDCQGWTHRRAAVNRGQRHRCASLRTRCCYFTVMLPAVTVAVGNATALRINPRLPAETVTAQGTPGTDRV